MNMENRTIQIGTKKVIKKKKEANTKKKPIKKIKKGKMKQI